jgi:glutamate dehydrogenase/leucine dehydrogenase
VLFGRGVPVIPDIVANAGGVIVSTFEWEQNLKGEHWDRAAVFRKLKAVLQEETAAIWGRAGELKADLRRCAYVVALERLEAAMTLKENG